MKSKKGFTMIEVLIVVGIIGILSTFLLPNVIQAHYKGRASRIVTDLRVIRDTLLRYHMEKYSWPRSRTWDRIPPEFRSYLPPPVRYSISQAGKPASPTRITAISPRPGSVAGDTRWFYEPGFGTSCWPTSCKGWPRTFSTAPRSIKIGECSSSLSNNRYHSSWSGIDSIISRTNSRSLFMSSGLFMK